MLECYHKGKSKALLVAAPFAEKVTLPAVRPEFDRLTCK
jgi:hypothetical protein